MLFDVKSDYVLLFMQLITFFGERVYTNEAMGSEASRLSFAGEYLSGDASLLISDLLLTDSGEYSCKVKSGGKITWNRVNLIVLGEPHPRGDLVTTRPRPIYTNTHTHTHT